MLSVKPQDATNRANDLAWVKSIWQEIENCLADQKMQVYAEIRHYPPPIPACDLQFNYLLEERSRISQELGRCGVVCKASLSASEPVRLLDEFVRSSVCLPDETKQKIQARLTHVG